MKENLYDIQGYNELTDSEHAMLNVIIQLIITLFYQHRN
jgi:hypothetical protein